MTETIEEIVEALKWHTKPNERQGKSDYRIWRAMEAGVKFAGTRVLEPGCGQGAITADLCMCGADVTAFDIRPENLVRTTIRCLYHHLHPWQMPKLCIHDAEGIHALGRFDLIVHIGLLYHLAKPVKHLIDVMEMADTILLDTHVAEDKHKAINEDAAGQWWDERDDDRGSRPGQERSFWLTRESLESVVAGSGFNHEVLIDDPNANCGRRVLWLLRKE